tara:strand:+ start:302 stop:457 length:156 start_codon:yes stop_codon:yes gene_type:complete
MLRTKTFLTELLSPNGNLLLGFVISASCAAIIGVGPFPNRELQEREFLNQR